MRLGNCWISPDGTWYDVELDSHKQSAQRILKKIYHRTTDPHTAHTVLLKRGWLSVTDGTFTGINRGMLFIMGYRMTVDQRAVLQEFHQGDSLCLQVIEDAWQEYGVED